MCWSYYWCDVIFIDHNKLHTTLIHNCLNHRESFIMMGTSRTVFLSLVCLLSGTKLDLWPLKLLISGSLRLPGERRCQRGMSVVEERLVQGYLFPSWICLGHSNFFPKYWLKTLHISPGRMLYYDMICSALFTSRVHCTQCIVQCNDGEPSFRWVSARKT